MLVDIQAYFLKDIEVELGLDQASLIAMAYLLGSDYTDGVKGIGIVNSMEIIQAFMRNPEQEVVIGSIDVTSQNLFCETVASADRIMSSLRLFKKWVDDYTVDVISDSKKVLESEATASSNTDEISVELSGQNARKRKREPPVEVDGIADDASKCAGLREEAKLVGISTSYLV